MATSSRRPHIFISHSHKDNDFGARLVQDLRRVIGDEAAVWDDSQGGVKGGDIWWLEISKELKRCNTFIVILTSNALKSAWVKKEMRLALMYNVQKNKKIIPILYQPCRIPNDYQDIQAISFLSDRTYEESFQELQVSLRLSKSSTTIKNAHLFEGSYKDKMQQLVLEVEGAYRKDDWPYVIKRVNAIAHQYLGDVPPSLYCMQGWAYYFENQPSLAQDALAKGLKLMQDPQKQLTLLDPYIAQLISGGQWSKVSVRTNETSQLDPHNSVWQTAKIDALGKIHLEVFICYARKDRQFLDDLQLHLMSLQRQGHISFWHEGDISAGKERQKAIEKYLDKAHIVLLLVSSDFMASDYCYQKEMKRAIERYKRGEVRIIPILIRPVHWESSPIGIFQALPKNGKPVTDASWRSQDEAFYDITTGIQKAVEELRLRPKPQMLIQKYFEHKDVLKEICQAGLIFCPECGSTELTGSNSTNYAHDETYHFGKCKNCGHVWKS